MNFKKLCIMTFISILLVGCSGTTSTSDGDNDDGNEGNDDGGTSSTIVTHNQGQACLNCHNGTTQKLLKSAGTVYTLLTAVDGIGSIANGYRIQLQMANGSNITFVSGRGTGNSNIQTANIATTDKFTAKVINSTGGVVKTSGTDTHDGTRLNCNSCHASTPTGGAPGRIVNQ